MKMVLLTIVPATLMCLGLPGTVRAQQANDGQGVEVLTRGPIHEAYAMPAIERQTAAPIVPKQPPAPINELPADMRPEGDQAEWIPGYWAWDDDRSDFIWVSGIWRVPPPNRHWMPGYWQPVDGGWRWVSGYWNDAALATQDLLPPPPDPVVEAIPPEPDNNSVYVPGIWVYQENQYLWRPGHWIACQAGWVWTPPLYCWTPGGYVFVSGFWDHDFDHRGLLFAPVFLDARFYRQPGWRFRPGHVVDHDFLLSSLFVNVKANRYFFGDFYERAYAGRGYVPWVDYRVNNVAHDPLFGYYRWRNRGNARWEENLRGVYTARRDHADQRPPRTLLQQERATKGPTVAVPLNRWKGPNIKLEPLKQAHAEEIHKNVEEWRNVSQKRGKIEMEARRPAPEPKAARVAAPVRIEVPRPTIRRPPAVRTAPPHPATPKLEHRPHK